jgi:hypothetical protein
MKARGSKINLRHIISGTSIDNRTVFSLLIILYKYRNIRRLPKDPYSVKWNSFAWRHNIVVVVMIESGLEGMFLFQLVRRLFPSVTLLL